MTRHTSHALDRARLRRLLGLERRNILYIYSYAALSGGFALTLPLGVQAIIGLISSGQVLQPVGLLIAFVALGTAANGGLQLLQLAVVERIQQRVFVRVAFEMERHLERIRLDVASGMDLPELMNRFFEVKTIQKSLGKLLTDWVAALLQLLFGLALLVFYHPYFSFFGGALIVVLALIFRTTGARGLATSYQESSYKYRVAHWLEERARTLVAFRVGGATSLGERRLDVEAAGYVENRRAHFRVLALQSLTLIAFKVFVSVGLLVMGSFLVVNRQITLGQFVASEILIVIVLAAIEKLILGLPDLYDLLTALEKADAVRQLPVDEKLSDRPLAPDGPVEIEVKDLNFTYPGEPRPALQDVTLRIPAGSRTVVTGPLGGGESTLLRLLAGAYREFHGAITYNGISLRDCGASNTAAHIAFCAPETLIFDGTLEDNVTLGRTGVTPNDALRALSSVGLSDWVHHLPEGLQTPMRAGGRALSADVTARLTLARAIVGEPRLLFIDQLLDQLDATSRHELLPIVFGAAGARTVVIASDHDDVIRMCDQHVHLHAGRVVPAAVTARVS